MGKMRDLILVMDYNMDNEKKELIKKLATQQFGAYQIALQVYPEFRKTPKEVAEELKQLLPPQVLVDVVGNLCVSCMAEVIKNPPKFLDDHEKKVKEKQQQMADLFGTALREFNEKDLKKNAIQ